VADVCVGVGVGVNVHIGVDLVVNVSVNVCVGIDVDICICIYFVSVVVQEIGPVRNNLPTMTRVVASDLLATTGEYYYACKTAIVI
jgi:hypothetical protein